MTKRRRPTVPTPKPRPRRPSGPAVDPEDVRLRPGKGGPGRGDGPGGRYWHICLGDQRVGSVYINVIDEPPVGVHASIQIELNADQRGRHIGRVAYRLACEESVHDEVYAHMRKSNTASRVAAERAGFEAIHPELGQLLMVWRRGDR